MQTSNRRVILYIVIGIVLAAVATCGGLVVVGDALNTLFTEVDVS